MALKDLQKILTQVHSPNEHQLVSHNPNHPLYWIWKIPNAKLSDLDLKLRKFRNDHARFDIFINGQYVLEKDYVVEQFGTDFHIQFVKQNFPYELSSSDIIKLEGDVETL